ncbi:hypothetical protein [Rhizobacter sp. Root1221]|uniref:hypothetical protein n=1 Tax=Rhizobacter sp. Root1221 TaxID=1736433 RepID=UPI0006FFC3ED|nr:hypothetical protein [Rhizobacter sp. Root1221]KQW00759.1 hypothetical protein ASC87_16220 [Rhizobacter sp. Root1221]
MSPFSRSLSAPRREALRSSLLDTVNLLKKRRAADIAPSDIDDYISLEWFEWNGGSLRLTDVGQNVCKQVTAGLS